MKKFYLTRDEKKAIPFILPGVAVTALLIIYPLFYIISMSFSENAIGQSGFAGLTNYLRLFKNPMFTSSIWNTLVWTLGTVIPAFLIGFILALYVSIIIVFIIHCMDHPGSCKSDGMEMVVYHRWRNDQSFIDEYRSN